MIKHHLNAALSLLIATVVVMSSLHVTQLASAATVDKTDTVKVHTELHNHIDKAGKIVGGDMAQIDARSLRLRDPKRPSKHNQFANLFDSWRDHLSLFLA